MSRFSGLVAGMRSRMPASARRPQAPPIATWGTIDASDTAAHPHAIDEILRREADGLTVTGVFTPEELDRVVGAIEGSEPERTPFPNGSVLGMPIGHIGPDSQDRGPYFEQAARARASYLSAFGFDPHERIREVIGPLAAGRRLQQPSEGGQEYIPGQLRWLDAGTSGLKVHADGEFGEHMRTGGMNHLDATTHIVDHLSYFAIIQHPDQGGELTLYDEARDTADHPHWDEGARPEDWFQAREWLTVDPAPGSLVLFGGGWRWHKVGAIVGSLPRITYGGFVAPSLDDAELHFWC